MQAPLSTLTSRCLSPVVVLLALGIVGARAQTTSPLRLERKIDLPDVEGRIDHMSIDVKAGRLFMAALGNDTVEVIDVGAGKRVRTVRGFDEPQGILVVPPIGRVFVANGRDGTVRVLDSSSFAPLQTVHLGDDADNLRLDPKTEHVWVGYGEGALAAIDAKGNKVMDVPLAGHPESFQLEKDGPRIFVNVPNAKRVAVVDRDKGAVVASWRTGDASANFPMALDEGNRRVFVVCRNPARLLVFDAD